MITTEGEERGGEEREEEKRESNKGAEELKLWMDRKRRERMKEYKRKREELVSKERVPYTPRRHGNKV